jgi:hypothetical protein
MDRGWHRSMRSRERQCVSQEMRNSEYGDVIFPIACEVSDPWSGDCGNTFYFIEDIRGKYFAQINSILTGYSKYFLECFNHIKGISSQGGEEFDFEWLNYKEVKAVIKKWTREPTDVLYYLTRSRIIEKAVRCELYWHIKK